MPFVTSEDEKDGEKKEEEDDFEGLDKDKSSLEEPEEQKEGEPMLSRAMTMLPGNLAQPEIDMTALPQKSNSELSGILHHRPSVSDSYISATYIDQKLKKQ